MKAGLGGAESRAGEYITDVKEVGLPKEIFLASDASAVVEHTKNVMIIEDDEVVHIRVHSFCPFSFIWMGSFRSFLLEN